MVVGNNESTTTKNVGESLVILIAMQMRRYDAGTLPDGARPGLHWKPLDAAIGQVPAPYRPVGRHGQRIR
jgi:hypothetical protein